MKIKPVKCRSMLYWVQGYLVFGFSAIFFTFLYKPPVGRVEFTKPYKCHTENA